MTLHGRLGIGARYSRGPADRSNGEETAKGERDSRTCARPMAERALSCVPIPTRLVALPAPLSLDLLR